MAAQRQAAGRVPSETIKLSRKKIYVNDDYTVTYTCPKCDAVITVNGLRYRGIEGAVDIKRLCECGHTFSAKLERRLYYRRRVNLKGAYSHRRDDMQKAMTVKDLSFAGLKFETFFEHPAINDHIWVEIFLGDDLTIVKDGFVRNLHGNLIGVEFCPFDENDETEKYYDNAVKLYLLS